MNVLFLTTHLNTGGITSYLLTLSKGMIERGVRVHIASSGGDMAAEFSALGARLLELNIRTKSELDPRIYCALLSLSQYIRRHAIDMIHAQTRVTQVMGFWLATMTGCPFVSTCHGFFNPRVSRLMFPCWGDAVVVISEAVQKHLHDDFQVADERISLIPSGIDMRMYTPADYAIKRQMRLKYDLGAEPVAGIIARLSEVKGQDILIRAMKTVVEQIPDAKLIIAGEGKTEPILRKMVKEFQLERNVLFYPFTNKAVEILPLLDIFVMPSRQEGLGISIMEAQAAGVPVIASRVGGIPSLIEEGKTGFLVEPEDPVSLGQTIRMVLRDPDRLARVANAGREFIRTDHSADLMVEKTLTLYKTTIPEARP
ncbi:MAG: glycosyltransferase family 4 protein [Candidatus Omnitrophica bacterium]|nr:glycosyltransferase family 4 protein [Candidatus Omnitrophota bacterium]